MKNLTMLFLLCASTYGFTRPENPVSAKEKFIQDHAPLAQWQELWSGIPASITLAQAILESQTGTSDLVKKGNNYFGIKYHGKWKGGFVFHDDDRRHEKFRRYSNVVESFEDHSHFLKGPRYRSLFDLKPNDYRGWAQGLQEAGYATDKEYATKLILCIVKNNLDRFDLQYENVAMFFPAM